MRHVFVETNWVVAYAAPAYQNIPAAIRLLESASRGEIALHLPSICISEARHPILQRYQVRDEADLVRRFILWGLDQQIVSRNEADPARLVLDRMEARVKNDLGKVDAVLESLKTCPGLEVFDMNQEMLVRCTELSFEKLDLKPFDQAILSAVLVHSKFLATKDERDLVFCELDGDLQPWDKQSNRKDRLAGLYDDAGVWVYGDFTLEAPPKPEGWAGGTA
jgi:hypothetical protein